MNQKKKKAKKDVKNASEHYPTCKKLSLKHSALM